MEGRLYPVGTPIGNLKDITLRALEILKQVDLIAAEDTRHTRKLLSHYDIHTSITSFYEHNQYHKIPYLLKELKEGKNIALVTNAGMPGISDPGYELIKEAIEKGIRVVPIPGPVALITALVVSGLPVRNFLFEGFLGRNRNERLKRLRELREEKSTIIVYEAPHRIRKLLPEIRQVLGDRQIAVARELTKKFEELIRGKVSQMEEIFRQRQPKGEFTLVIEGKRGREDLGCSTKGSRKF